MKREEKEKMQLLQSELTSGERTLESYISANKHCVLCIEK